MPRILLAAIAFAARGPEDQGGQPEDEDADEEAREKKGVEEGQAGEETRREEGPLSALFAAARS